MKKQFLNLGKALSKAEQKEINGGLGPECPVSDPSLGCYTGPFYCNTFGLPICTKYDYTN
ncbi:MAG: hypothetical protein COC22_04940 [Flavobacteriaceae bacterium]|nr:MAG: hypothetical protein COC22_04940 [Flavobacteriaceae bacterium]